MTNAAFDRYWEQWISHHLENGSPKESMFKILLDGGFTHRAIEERLGIALEVPLEYVDRRLSPGEPSSAARTRACAKLYLPNAQKYDSKKIELYVLDDFLNRDECERLIAIIKSDLEPSGIIPHDEPDKSFRTSRTCTFEKNSDPLVVQVDQRICKIMGIHPSYTESIQGVLYEPGEQFKPHTDCFDPNSTNYEYAGGDKGQRTWTFMLYLNTLEEGGGTRFTALDKTFQPIQGRALVWKNTLPSGLPNPYTKHHGMAVVRGYKAILTKWFRQRGRGPRWTKEYNEHIPNYTRIGFEKTHIPKKSFDDVCRYYYARRNNTTREHASDSIVNPHRHGSDMIELPDRLRRALHDSLRPICETWSGVELEPTYVYGIRIYRRGSTLVFHRDRPATHIISAILNIDQKVDSDWPLVIDDNYYRTHRVFMTPGQMVLYEGGRLSHGRPEPLDGDYFCNVFVHYKPKDYIAWQHVAELATH